MSVYVVWIKFLGGKLVFVVYFVGFDFLFVYWYLVWFVGESFFSYLVFDMKIYVMVVLKMCYFDSMKWNMFWSWFLLIVSVMLGMRY